MINNNEGYSIKNQQAKHFLTFTVCGWIDLFTRKAYRDILIDSFKYCQQEKGLEINAFVIMSNHVHLIARANGKNTLSDIVRDFKKFTHKKMIEIIETHGFTNKIDIELILQHIEKIKPLATGFDKESGLFFNHIAT